MRTLQLFDAFWWEEIVTTWALWSLILYQNGMMIAQYEAYSRDEIEESQP